MSASALFLLADLGSYPIVLWDESRLAVNAIEMYLTGPGLVTTYNFEPDLWNTKPPLLIWLMTASMTLFGASEWALRLPSALAALGTVAVTMVFTWRLTRSAAAAVLACALLVASPGFYGVHAAATGDYDALLTLFATSYLCVLFFTVHRRVPPLRWLLWAGVLIAAATLTKGVAGLIPGVGVGVYLLLVRRWTRPLITPRYLVAAGVVLFATGVFYGLREMAAPGYIQAVVQNELAGRYLETLGGHPRPWSYYAGLLLRETFSAGPLLLAVPLGFVVAAGRVRLGIVFASCIAGAILLVFSTSATKLPWYIVPAYPFLATALALSGFALAARATQSGRAFVLAACAAAVVAVAAYRHEPLSAAAVPRQARYGRVFADLHNRGVHTVSVVDGGVRNSEGFEAYSPRLRFYQLMWRTRSFTVREVAADVAALEKRPGTIVVTCDRRYVQVLRSRGTQVAALPGCISVRL